MTMHLCSLWTVQITRTLKASWDEGWQAKRLFLRLNCAANALNWVWRAIFCPLCTPQSQKIEACLAGSSQSCLDMGQKIGPLKCIGHFRSNLPMFGVINTYSQELVWLPWGCKDQTHVIWKMVNISQAADFSSILLPLQPLGRCETDLRHYWGLWTSGLRTRKIRQKTWDRLQSWAKNANFSGFNSSWK